MSSWSPWDWIAYIVLFISAIIIAIIQWSKDMTLPSFIPTNFLKIPWNYIPLILIMIATTIFIFKGLGWIDSTKKMPNKFQFNSDAKFIEIKNEKFVNEVVPLDGYSYEYCDFTNVTFHWNGTALFHMKHNNIYGMSWIRSENDSIAGTFALLKTLNMLKDNIPLVDRDSGDLFDPKTKIVK